ncbi:AAA family ATPase [Phytohabitans sp. ZYX-F-186]|uniref:AAA family ATPase n=1 Tax=Phytohabitans maris TaxID=3071409 RepID=A0ABU0ZGB7_9ACTN|nr:UvrD-helicase domain-containing protein [Phytohabitans sp. ZYX-F-186]MDQ7906104.1 AAA family ATPase [Phytohabitans sp. ZYX-F-186]
MPDARTQEIAAEQRVVDRVYARLDGMRERAKALAAEGHGRAAAGTLTGLVERDAMVHRAAARLRSVDAEAEGLVFGRLDLDDGETYHIGRLGVRDDDREPLLVDWRAPAAAPFYRATSGQPLGVVRRRVIICRGQRVVDLDDDVLSPDRAGELQVLGEGALLAALRRSRGAHMRDIVTTIQREQDEAIRAPARGVTLVTGGPGTGKTQVALHRAAYLLYTDRGRFTDGRILVVGPSTVFTSYISRVLPSLGEESVHLRALGELVDGVTATRRDPAALAEIKGGERMCGVLAELMWQAPPAAPDRLRLVYAGQVLTLDAADLAAARRRVRQRCAATRTPPNAARPQAVAVLLDALWSKVDGAHVDRGLFVEDAGDRPELHRFLRAWWPPLTPAGVLSWLADPARVVGLPAQAAALLAASYSAGRGDRSAASSDGGRDWSVDDVPLLDELAELLGEPPAAPRAPEPEWRLRELTTGTRTVDDFVISCGLRDGWELYAPGHPTPIAAAGQAIDNDAIVAAQRWAEALILREGHRVVGWKDGFDPHGEDAYKAVLAEPLPVQEPDDEPPAEDRYLHVILDEAQDLSPMECRMVARRAEYASMTVVGDLGQATHPLAAGSWPELLGRLGKREVRTLELRTGYRVPRAIADYAARALAPGIAPTRSYRPGGTLSVRRVDDLRAAVGEEVRRAPRDATVAVVVADAFAPRVDAPGVAVVPASLVKGLEYDHVVVVEPADIVDAEPRGLNRLYVALTRAVAGLVVLHHKPLPAVLRG